MGRIAFLLAAAAVALGVATSAVAAASGWRVIGRGSASGEFAVAAASGTAKKPRQVAVRVTITGGGRVSALSVVACSKGFGVGSKSQTFAGRSPLMRVLRLPMRGADSCDVTASGSSSAGGRLVVQILKR